MAAGILVLKYQHPQVFLKDDRELLIIIKFQGLNTTTFTQAIPFIDVQGHH